MIDRSAAASRVRTPRRRPDGPRVAARCIGFLLAVAQTAAQDLPVLRLAVPDRDRTVVAPILDALRPERSANWLTGLRQANSLGAVVCPPLQRELQEASDYRLRLLRIAAVAAADPIDSVRFLLERVTTARSRLDELRERLLIGLILAMGPEREGSAPTLIRALRRGSGNRVSTPIEITAAALALARFPDAPGIRGLLRYDTSDPGLAAAARFSRPPLAGQSVVDWSAVGALPGAELVERATLLRARLGEFDPAVGDRVIGVMSRTGDENRELRRAAALLIATAEVAAPWFDGIEPVLGPELLAPLCTGPEFRTELFRRGRLGTPAEWLDPDDRLQIALAFAMCTDLEQLQVTRAGWTREPALARVVCLGVAVRALAEDPEVTRQWLAALPGEPELEWLRLALGDQVLQSSRYFEDPELDAAFVMATRAGGSRLSPSAMRLILESALWRAGAHLGLIRIRAEQDLVRDLLLAGSDYGRNAADRGVSGADHLPAGLSTSDTAFEISYAAWRFFRAPGPWRLEAPRLR